MCLTSVQFDVTLAAMNCWKSICRMKNPAGPDGMQIKWPSSFPSWELQRVSERKSLTNYNTALKTFSPSVNKDKGMHQSCWRIVIMRRQSVAECVSSDAACFPFQAAMLVLLLRKSLQQKHWLWPLGPSNDFVILTSETPECTHCPIASFSQGRKSGYVSCLENWRRTCA